MLRKLGIVLTVIALGMTSIQTDAFARGSGHGGGSGGHIGGGGDFGGGQSGARGYGMDRGAFNSRASGLRLHDQARLRPGFGNDSGWSDSCFSHPYGYRYPHCYDGYFF